MTCFDQRALVLILVGACGSVGDKPDAKPADAPKSDAAIDGMQAFLPTDLSGLVLWLDASQNVVTNQSKVSSWMDLSGRNNNAGQAVAQIQPSLVTGVVNGKPVIRFAGTALQINDSASLQWGTDDFALVVVASYSNDPASNYGMFVAKQNTASPYAGPGLWANYTVPSASTVVALQTDNSGTQYAVSATGMNDGVARLYVGRRAGNTLEVRVNGAASGTSTATPISVSAAGSPMYVGGAVGSNSTVIQALAGDLAEVVAVHGTLSTTDLAKLEAYLKAKYAL